MLCCSLAEAGGSFGLCVQAGTVHMPWFFFSSPPDPRMSGLDVVATAVGKELRCKAQWWWLEAKGRNGSSQNH